MDNQFYENNTPEQNAPQETYEAPAQFIPPAEAPKKKKSSGMGRLVAVALCCSLAGGILGALAVMLAGGQVPSVTGSTQVLQGQRENTVIQMAQIDTSKLMTPAQVYAANVNSTVGITTSVTTNFWGFQTTTPASGSGFILTEDGYILTNHHVIEDSSSITVRLYNGESYDATLKGYDERNDIAVLKVDATGLTPVVLGDSDNMNVGDSVVAIGNPLGELTFSLTAGAVSALDREVTMSNGITMNLIQTDCAINSGNSGGALFNLYGEVVGITNAKYSSGSGEASIDNIGFAIPLNDVWSMVESIMEKGYISKPYIGVSVQDVSAETQSYGLPQGAAVRVVAEDSPAQKAGLQVNDIITHIGDTQITGSNHLVRMVSQSAVGDRLTLTVYRQGATITLELTVGEQIQDAAQQEPQTEQSSQYPDFPFPGYGW